MKIVDLDNVTKKELPGVTAWILSSFINENGQMAPNEAIYFFSSRSDFSSYEIAEELGLIHPKISPKNYWNEKTISTMLRKMISGLNEARSKHGMPMIERFDHFARTRVQVLSSREFADIERLGALPVPMQLIGEMKCP